jgi:hypothetical protein
MRTCWELIGNKEGKQKKNSLHPIQTSYFWGASGWMGRDKFVQARYKISAQ